MHRQNQQNPYLPPAISAVEPPNLRVQVSPAVGKVLLRWSGICIVSAVPSFFWGCTLHNGFQHITAMLAGIAVFVVAYTLVEFSAWFQRLVQAPGVRGTLMVGYGTRIVVSLIFPVGAMIDMFTGMISVSLVAGLPLGEGAQDLEQATFLAVFLTTICQGVLLNAVLFVYMAAIYAIQRLVVAAGRQLARETQPGL